MKRNLFWLAVLGVVVMVLLMQVDVTADTVDWLAVNWNSRRGG